MHLFTLLPLTRSGTCACAPDMSPAPVLALRACGDRVAGAADATRPGSRVFADRGAGSTGREVMVGGGRAGPAALRRDTAPRVFGLLLIPRDGCPRASRGLTFRMLGEPAERGPFLATGAES